MKQIDEKLSLLLDDYSDGDADAALDEVSADVNLQYRMRRYQMIGEVMRHELPGAVDPDFHHQVMAKIREQEKSSAPAPGESKASTLPASITARSWFRPFAGMAVAASVALVTVALWQPQQRQTGLEDGELASADQQKIEQLGQQLQGSAVQASSRVQSDGMRWKLKNESPVLQQKLNAYLVNHTEYSNSMQGLIPQARVAGFDGQQQQ
jgi:sigma-E factor negative regulatory protein RseA